MIERLSNAARRALLSAIQTSPWLLVYDNLNIAMKAYEQRLDNLSHFDSGTAGTIFVFKDPAAPQLPMTSEMQDVLTVGSAHPITWKDIITRERQATPRIRERAIYRVLRFLVESPAFDFMTYENKDSAVFRPPNSIHQLPTGPSTAACQFMLDTLHVEEATYEGNIICLEEFFNQMGFHSDEERKQLVSRIRVCVGDQMTISRIRGIQKFRSQDLNSYERGEFLQKQCGFLHAQMSQENSFHTQYYGTQAGLGLVHAFDLLKRRGLSSPSVKGTFHHDIKEGLYHIAEARFRDLWCIISGVEKLEHLRDQSPEQLRTLATQIVSSFSSTSAMQKLSCEPDDRQDNLLYQAIQWNRDILDYIDFNEAMSEGDVGRMEDQFPRLLFRFVGGGSSNYSIEMLELLQFLDRESTSPLRYSFCHSSYIILISVLQRLCTAILLAYQYHRKTWWIHSNRSGTRAQCSRYQGVP